MITLRQLEALRFVLKYGTVTEASNMMNLSQPALSQLISNLEYESGLTLFRRERRRLHPTDEAFLLSHHAEEIFKGLRQVEKVSREIRNKRTGRLHVTSVLMLGRETLPGLLAEFLEDKPDVEASIGIQPQSAVRNQVAGQSCDIGYSFWGKPHPGIRVLKSYRFPLVCVMSNDDPLTGEGVIAISDLEGRTLVTLDDGSRSQEALDRQFEQANVGYTNQISVQQTEIACELVSKGCGVAIVNPFAAAEYQRLGKLCAKPFHSPVEVEVCVIVPRGKETSLVAQDFHEKVDDALEKFNEQLGGK